jgi:capsular exopolysaccharide synthesis family protein
VVFQPNNSASIFGNGTLPNADPARQVQTQIEVLSSPPVRDLVAKALKMSPPPKVTASAITGTNALQIRAASTVARTASDTANAYAAAFTTYTQTQASDYIASVSKQLQSEIGGLQEQVNALDAQVSAAQVSARATVQTNLSPQRQLLLSELANLQETLSKAQAQAVTPTNGAQLITPAKVPSSPSSPKPVRDAALGLIVGILFGTAVALLRDFLDDALMSKEDLERASSGLPVVGLVPAVPSWKPSDGPRLVSVETPMSPTAEAYRSIRATTQFLSTESSLQVLQVTSPSAGEGKTTTVANLGVAMAGAGHNVCVCCSDLRRPRLHEFFGLSPEEGLTSVLTGDIPLSAAIQLVPHVPRLSVLPAGPTFGDPSELISSSRVPALLDALRRQFDIVLIDSPPVLPVADAVVLSQLVDAVLIVARVGTTTRRGISRTLELLRGVEAPLVGSVLNGVSDEGAYGYGDQYYVYYNSSAPGRRQSDQSRSVGGRTRRSDAHAAAE